MNFVHRSLVLACTLACGSASFAQTTGPVNPWTLRLGPTWVQFHSKTSVALAGTTLAGANVEASNNTTLGIELAYANTPNLTTRLALGIPPTTRLAGTGPLAGAGELAKLKYGPAVLSVTYSAEGVGAVRPYVGAGMNYTVVLASMDGAIESFDAKSAFGSALQAGIDLPLDSSWGAFVDLKKIFVKTTATGTVGGAPASAAARLDPLLVTVGLSRRF